jgi:capsular exopolysaccharide synthesis family protein
MKPSAPPEGVTTPTPLSRNGRTSPSTAPAPLVMLSDPHAPAAEAYRSLATNLQFSSLDQPVRTVVVTSAAPGEGKSTTVANLAIALAEGGRRVIVVDADLRRPGLHALFGASNREGLTSALIGDQPQLPLQDTAVPGVRILASGPLPPNPLEVLGSRRLDQVLALARSQADFVLVDTAPAAALADAWVLAPRLDGVLLVVSAGRTRRDLARRAKEQLERVNARILGVVLTGVRVDDRLYAYGRGEG